MLRQPAVAGSFYPSQPDELAAQVDACLTGTNNANKVKGIIVPHAGYVYSGAVAGKVFSAAEIPEKVILIGPNHHGGGENVAVSNADSWQTPLGAVPVAKLLREQLVADVFPLVADDQAHQFEHSLEVMLPFLQQRQPKVEIVPITIGSLSLSQALQLGAAIAHTLSNWDEEVLLLASTDMNHFSDAETTRKLDAIAIEAMTAYDPAQLYNVVRGHKISMCGVLPTIIVMQAAYELGARTCALVDYAHSGQVNGDNSRVVGYAGLTIQ